MSINAGTFYESSGSATSHSIPYPSGVGTGNKLVLIFAYSDQYFAPTFTATGFTERIVVEQPTSTEDYFCLFDKVSAGETGSISVATDIDVGHCIGIVLELTGEDAGDIDASASGTNSSAGGDTSPICPAGTATASNNLVLRPVMANFESVVFTEPGGTTDLGSGSESNINRGVSIAHEDVASTTIPTATWTLGFSASWTTMTVVYAKVVAGGATITPATGPWYGADGKQIR